MQQEAKKHLIGDELRSVKSGIRVLCKRLAELEADVVACKAVLEQIVEQVEQLEISIGYARKGVY